MVNIFHKLQMVTLHLKLLPMMESYPVRPITPVFDGSIKHPPFDDKSYKK